MSDMYADYEEFKDNPTTFPLTNDLVTAHSLNDVRFLLGSQPNKDLLGDHKLTRPRYLKEINAAYVALGLRNVREHLERIGTDVTCYIDAAGLHLVYEDKKWRMTIHAATNLLNNTRKGSKTLENLF